MSNPVQQIFESPPMQVQIVSLLGVAAFSSLAAGVSTRVLYDLIKAGPAFATRSYLQGMRLSNFFQGGPLYNPAVHLEHDGKPFLSIRHDKELGPCLEERWRPNAFRSKLGPCE